MLLEISYARVVTDAVAVDVVANPCNIHLRVAFRCRATVFTTSNEAVLFRLYVVEVGMRELISLAVGDRAAEHAIVAPLHLF